MTVADTVITDVRRFIISFERSAGWDTSSYNHLLLCARSRTGLRWLSLLHKCQLVENMTRWVCVCVVLCICLEITHMIWDNVKLWCQTQSSGETFFSRSGWKTWVIVVRYSLAQMKDTNHFLSSARCRLSVTFREQHRKISTLCNLETSCHTYIHLVKTQERVFDLQISPFTNCCFSL